MLREPLLESLFLFVKNSETLIKYVFHEWETKSWESRSKTGFLFGKGLQSFTFQLDLVHMLPAHQNWAMTYMGHRIWAHEFFYSKIPKL